MRLLFAVVVAVALAGPGCGEDGERPAAAVQPTPTPEAVTGAAEPEENADARRPRRRGTRIVVGGSEFGAMLFDSEQQAIYIFEQDPRGSSACYGECAEAWPPVVTDGRPVAGKGVDPGLLGTVKRRGGRRQVTYADQPLYYYAHEKPGEVRCHNVNLNGGFWWVVGPGGGRLP